MANTTAQSLGNIEQASFILIEGVKGGCTIKEFKDYVVMLGFSYVGEGVGMQQTPGSVYAKYDTAADVFLGKISASNKKIPKVTMVNAVRIEGGDWEKNIVDEYTEVLVYQYKADPQNDTLSFQFSAAKLSHSVTLYDEKTGKKAGNSAYLFDFVQGSRS